MFVSHNSDISTDWWIIWVVALHCYRYQKTKQSSVISNIIWIYIYNIHTLLENIKFICIDLNHFILIIILFIWSLNEGKCYNKDDMMTDMMVVFLPKMICHDMTEIL
jgi:hypothetical protein